MLRAAWQWASATSTTQVYTQCHAQNVLLHSMRQASGRNIRLTGGPPHAHLHAVLLNRLQIATSVDYSVLFQGKLARAVVLQGWRPGLRRRQAQGGSSSWTGTCTLATARSRSSRTTPASSTCPSTATMGAPPCSAILKTAPPNNTMSDMSYGKTWCPWHGCQGGSLSLEVPDCLLC